MEEANAFQRMLDQGYTVERLAKEIGVQPLRITYRLQFLKLDPAIQQVLAKEQITRNAAYELSRLPSHTEQRKLLSMVSNGVLKNDKQVRIAVETIIANDTQEVMFEDMPSPATAQELATVSEMEARIDRVLAAVTGGWKDGECVIAKRIAPDRAGVVAEKLAALRLTLKKMEDQLRAAAVTGTLALQSAA